MKEVKSIDALYAEVRGCDLVLCNDAPLATALNNRVDTARLGLFAVTPRELAAKLAVEVAGVPIMDDVRLVKKVADETGYGLRYVHGEITNFKAAARYTAEPRMGRKSRKVWDAYRQYNTLDKLMRGMSGHVEEFYRGKKVAVIGLELFDDLDKNMLPPTGEFEDVEIFTEGGFAIPEMRSLGNDRLIAECAADMAKRCGPDDVAIVMDVSGPIADAVKSALYRERIPFINTLAVRDLGSVRNFLEFIQLSLSYRTVLVRDVRELVSAYGGYVAGRYDRYNFSKFIASGIPRSDRTAEIAGIMETAGNRTFRDMVQCVPPGDRSSIVMLLSQMECTDSQVTQDILDDLVYAVDNIAALEHNEQISQDEKSGVLLVDCKNSVFIDRPVVVYTGMCSEWEVDLGDLDYIDPKKKLDIDYVNVLRFEALVQQGSARYYFVNATKDGKEAVPCRYFDACERSRSYDWGDDGEDPPEPVEHFEQVCPSITKGPWRIVKSDRSVKAQALDIEGGTAPAAFSNSSYMNFVECPRKYLYSRLAGGADNSSTYTGTMLHNYAEFRMSYPDIAAGNGPDYYTDMIARECAPLSSPDLAEIERSKISAAVMAIDMFADKLKVEPGNLQPRPADKEEDNMFLVHHGLSGTSEHTEKEFSSRDSAMKGIIDLLWDGVIYDYKTGKPENARVLAKKFDMSDVREGKRINGHKSCQALFYMCLLQDCGIENKGCFDLFFAQQMYNQLLAGKPADAGACIVSVVLAESHDEVMRRYIPNLLAESKTYDRIDTVSCYRLCVEEAGPEPSAWIGDPDLAYKVAERFGMVSKKTGEPGKTNLKDAAAAVKRIANALLGDYVVAGDRLVVTRHTVDLFRKGLLEDLERLRSYYCTDFPASPLVDCAKCEFRDMCTGEKMTEDDADESE